MKTIGYLLFALLPVAASAATYPVDIDQQLNGAEVTVTPQVIDRDLAGLLLHNHGRRRPCTAVFQNGPEAPRTRRTELQPGERATSKFKRDVIRLRIKLTCEPK